MWVFDQWPDSTTEDLLVMELHPLGTTTVVLLPMGLRGQPLRTEPFVFMLAVVCVLDGSENSYMLYGFVVTHFVAI